VSATSHARTLSLPLPTGVDLSAPTSLARASISLCVAGPPRQRREPYARALALSLAAPWGPFVSSVFPATAADPRSRTRRGDRPRRSLTHPSSFLSPPPHSLSPVSFRPLSPSSVAVRARQRSAATLPVVQSVGMKTGRIQPDTGSSCILP
jgi:hypothetical protein